MSAAIGPGDWIECIQNRSPTTLPPLGLVVGRIYRVDAVGVLGPDDEEPGVPWVRVAGAALRPGKLGFRLAWFRPTYRPDPQFIDSLKQPAPERELEPA